MVVPLSTLTVGAAVTPLLVKTGIYHVREDLRFTDALKHSNGSSTQIASHGIGSQQHTSPMMRVFI